MVTGVLESLERTEAEDIIKQYGGKVMTTVGKRLKYLIAGEEAGPKKLAVAEENGIQIISEDGFLDLIREKSGLNGKIEIKENGTRNGKEKIAGKSPENVNKTISPAKRKIKLTPENNIKSAKIASHHLKGENGQTVPKLAAEQSGKLKLNKSPNNIKTAATAVGKMSPVKKKIVSVPDSCLVKVEGNEMKQKLSGQESKINEDNMAWVDKYKPSSIKDIVGQQGPSSNVNK